MNGYFSSNPAFAVRIKIDTKAPSNFKSAKIIKKMFREIKEKTDGNVVFKVYYSGVKGTGRDLRLKMRSGEIHGGHFQEPPEGLPTLLFNVEIAAFIVAYVGTLFFNEMT